MATVKVRIEPSSIRPERGSIYYRLYQGHNRRMEFSSGIIVPLSLWNPELCLLNECHEKAPKVNKLIKSDVERINGIIAKFDLAGRKYTMADIAKIFNRVKRKRAKTVL